MKDYKVIDIPAEQFIDRTLCDIAAEGWILLNWHPNGPGYKTVWERQQLLSEVKFATASEWEKFKKDLPTPPLICSWDRAEWRPKEEEDAD